MIRRAMVILVCLLLGALANVIVVVLLSCLVPAVHTMQPSSKVYHSEAPPGVYVFVHERFGVDTVHASNRAPHMDEPYHGMLDDMPAWIEETMLDSVGMVIARGWPWRAAYHESLHGWTMYSGVGEIGGWATPLPPWRTAGHVNLPRVIPYQPIWRGVIVNTLCYAAILWMMWMMLTAIRRVRRRRKGLCPACAYDLRGAAHVRCPECGAAAMNVRPR